MRRTQHALVAFIAAAVLVALAAPAWAASSRSFSTGSKQVRAGQRLQLSAKGCRSRASVRIYLSGRRIESFDANSQGRFSELVEIPSSTDVGDHWIKAGCSGHYLGVVKIVVLHSRFSVRPRTVAPGAFQSLPPPVGITQLPPTPVQPPATGVAPSAQVDTAGRLAAARRHPLRLHPRPAERAGASGRAAASSARPAAAGTGGGDQGGSGTITRPPVAPPAVEAAPVARVRVPSAEVRVTPPAVLGRDLPEVRVRTPEVRVDAPTIEALRLRLS
jgi:hypothetical protein